MSKKVLFIFCYDNFSGAEIVMQRMINNDKSIIPVIMYPGGNLISHLTRDDAVVIEDHLLGAVNVSGKENIVSKISKTALKFIKINFRVLRFIFANKVDVTHANNLAASFYIWPTVIFCRLFFVKKMFVWSNHDLTYISGKKADNIARLSNKIYHKNIVVSEAVKNKFPDQVAKSAVLYNGLELETYKFDVSGRTAFRNKYFLAENDIAIGVIGSIVEHKGQAFLMQAFKQLLGDHQNLKLFVIGRHANIASAYSIGLIKEAQTFEQGIVNFIEHTNNITQVYSGLDIVANCTLSQAQEPLGTTIYEGMAFERIVIASNTGGSSEIVTDNLDGYLFTASDLKSFIARMQFILSNFEGLSAVRKNARKKAISKFSIEKTVANYNKIINNI